MVILKRLAVWVLEQSCAALLLGLFLIVLFGHDPHTFENGLLPYIVLIDLMWFTTGYALTTALSRSVWSGQRLWSYPVVAITLFWIHFEIMNVGLDGAFEPLDRLRIGAAGMCIVFACTFGGSWLLQKWAQTRPVA